MGTVIKSIGGLCLEIYVVQKFLILDKWNNMFPFNILLVFIIILIGAYLTRCLARFVSQLFNDAPFEWREIVRF